MSPRRAALIAVTAVAVGFVGYRSLAAPSHSSAMPVDIPHGTTVPASIGIGDGVLPAGTTVYSTLPGVARLDPALLRALRRAAAVGPQIVVNSGWRSERYQEQLLEQAVARYGSRAKAAHWVAPPDKSSHVSGDAVDIGPPASASWLARHGAPFGLCRIYASEPWHFELRPRAVTQGCPLMYSDPTHDPRMQRTYRAPAPFEKKAQVRRPGPSRYLANTRV